MLQLILTGSSCHLFSQYFRDLHGGDMVGFQFSSIEKVQKPDGGHHKQLLKQKVWWIHKPNTHISLGLYQRRDISLFL